MNRALFRSLLCSLAIAMAWTMTVRSSAAESDRIVAIGGTITEVLYAIGLGGSIVAVDLTSDYPDDAQSKPRVGYMRALSAEGILAVAPTLILAIEDAGPPEVIAQLESASVPFARIPKPKTAAEVPAMIRTVAAAVGRSEQGDEVANAVAEDLAIVTSLAGKPDEQRKVLFLLGIADGSPLAAGDGTSAAGMFSLAGLENALGGMAGYKTVSEEAVLAAAPQAIILMADQSHDIGDEAVLASPALARTPAAQDKRLVRFSGPYLLNFGPRTAHAARDLLAAVYPELEWPELPERPWAIRSAKKPGNDGG